MSESKTTRLEGLIAYAEDALQDNYPFEVTGDDLREVLKALKAAKDRFTGSESSP